jgi:hypothetical protein
LHWDASIASQVTNPASSLQITIMNPNALQFNLRSPSSLQLEVQVKDPQGRPVRRAVVAFLILPSSGATAYFVNRSTMVTVMTDENGMASTQLSQPNGVEGAFEISVTASAIDGLKGAARITVTNFRPPGAGSAGKWVALGAAGVGGVVAAILLARKPPPPMMGTQPPILQPIQATTTITPGPGTIR